MGGLCNRRARWLQRARSPAGLEDPRACLEGRDVSCAAMARSHRRRAGRRSFAGALAGALPVVVALAGLTISSRAEADEGFDDDALKAIIGGGVAAADIMFFAYDVGIMVAKRHPSVGWSIAQTAITAPQTLMFGALAIAGELDEKEELLIPSFLAAMFTGAMTTHGIWSLSSDSVSAVELFTISPVIAANTVLTTAALAKATGGELGSPTLGILELSLAGPTGSLFVYKSAVDEENRSEWIGLSVWSGVILLHGAASVLAWRVDEFDDSARVRLPDLPFTIQGFGPSVVSDGFSAVPGVRIAGKF
jgi:hypothetical protein